VLDYQRVEGELTGAKGGRGSAGSIGLGGRGGGGSRGWCGEGGARAVVGGECAGEDMGGTRGLTSGPGLPAEERRERERGAGR
jgi:hypothetical protein